jgi:hypothetical protein
MLNELHLVANKKWKKILINLFTCFCLFRIMRNQFRGILPPKMRQTFVKLRDDLSIALELRMQLAKHQVHA